MKTIELTHDEVCHALIQYIERDKNEHVTGTPTLCITSDSNGNLRTCSLVLNEHNTQQISKEVYDKFIPSLQELNEVNKGSKKLDEDNLNNYDSRDGRWIIDHYS
jgi:hypothetical protein